MSSKQVNINDASDPAPVTSNPAPVTSNPAPVVSRMRFTSAQIINSYINIRLQQEEEQDIQDAIIASLRD